MDEMLNDLMNPNKPMPRFINPTPRNRSALYSQPLAVQEEVRSIPRGRGTAYADEYQLEYDAIPNNTEDMETDSKEQVRQQIEAQLRDSHITSEDREAVYEDNDPMRDRMTDTCDEDTLHLYRKYSVGRSTQSSLPIEKSKDRILQLVDDNPAVVISGFTGCGKSTQVPQFLLDHSARKKAYCNVVVVQPRRIAATSLASRVCHERRWPTGSICGHQIGLDQHASEDTRILYCTTGVFLQKLISKKHMRDYTHIILDEVHERGQELDMTLILVRHFLRTNSRHVKVILMSATIHADRFIEYFMSGSSMQVPGIEIDTDEPFSVRESYLEDLEMYGKIPSSSFSQKPVLNVDVIDICVKLVADLESEDYVCERASVLVFLPGMLEIDRVYNALDEQNGKHRDLKWVLLPLHSKLPERNQHRIFEPIPSGHRKIILATNIAESSITVPDVKYVIDFCLTKCLVTDKETNFTSLHLEWCSQSSCTQRRGRAGRVSNGQVYRLVPKRFYDSFEKYSEPEIRRCSIEKLILASKKLDMGEPKAVLAWAMDPPDLGNIELTILTLKEVGALLLTTQGQIKQDDGDLTFVGRVMADLPVSVQVAKLIVLGYIFGVLRECVIIGAAMSQKCPFLVPHGQRLEAYKCKLKWAKGSFSDCMVLLAAFEEWKKQKENINQIETSSRRIQRNRRSADVWAEDNYLEPKVLVEIENLVCEITERLTEKGIRVARGHVDWSLSERNVLIKIAVAGACYPYYFVRGQEMGHVDERAVARELEKRNPFNTVYLKGFDIQQPASLYLPQVKTFFQSFSYVPDLSVSGDGSRFFATFKEMGNCLGQSCGIHSDVYVALKMAQLEMKCPIRFYDRDTAEDKYDKLKALHRHMRRAIWRIPQPVAPPSVTVVEVQIIITNVVDPSLFYAQYASNYTAIMEMGITLSREMQSLETVNDKIHVGEFYLVPSTKQSLQYCRAKVLKVIPGGESSNVQVFLIDYGIIETVMSDQLRHVPLKYTKFPSQAMQCKLAEIGPTPHEFDGAWSEEATLLFCKEFQPNEDVMEAKVHSISDGVVALTVYTQESSLEKNRESINDILMKKHHAVFVEDGYLSKRDHADRCAAELGNASGPSMELSRLQGDMDSWMQTLEDRVDDDYADIRDLDGPMSPLKIQIYPLNKYMTEVTGKKVYIDKQSVNSILLDAYPSDPHERLVVAATVRQSDRSTDFITVYDTTQMPNIHGLSSLICMLFAPQMELRVNEDNTRYTGALCGLGADEQGRSIYKEHDMEITFDTVINNEDIFKVNDIRTIMNKMLDNIPGEMILEATDEDIIQRQKKLRSLLFASNLNCPGLLLRCRESKAVEYFNGQYKWKFNKNQPRTYTHSAEDHGKLEAMFPLHSCHHLQEDYRYDDRILKNLCFLRSCAQRSKLGDGLDCDLCSTKLDTSECVTLHLLTPTHKDAVNKWRVAARKRGNPTDE